MFARLRGRARDVRTLTTLLQEAEAVARRDGQEVPGPEHVVVAATVLDDGSAQAALRAVGLDPATLEAEVRRTHDAALGVAPDEADDAPVATPGEPSGVHRMTPTGQAFLRALHDVHQQDGGRLCGAHVLVAAATLERGVWPALLAAHDLTPAAVADAAHAALAARPDDA